MKSSPTPLVLVKLCCAALAEKKAVDLRVLDISRQSSITDYLVLATGTSEPHLRALRVEIEKVLDAAGAHIVGIETAQESGWTVVDTFDVMVHLFTAENRAKYRLESLWKDAVEVSVPALLGLEDSPKAPKPAGRKRVVAPRKKKARSAEK
jgi:ribosome-associated protein